MSSGNKTLTLSVGELVQFSARCGDLNRRLEGPTGLEGVQGHIRVQKKRQPPWQSEYSVQHTVNHKDYAVTLRGRIDLLDVSNTRPIIEEIKTTYLPPAQLPHDKKTEHWAQAKIYGFLYGISQDPPASSLDVRMTWYDLSEEKEYQEQRICAFDELQDFAHALLDIYVMWMETLECHRQDVASSAIDLDFPFPEYRKGQYAFAQQVYRSIRDKHQLLIEAPTGIGKTISALFPSIKALGKGLIEQIFYLTLKGTAQSLALETLAMLCKKGLRLGFVQLEAKDKSCPCRQTPSQDIDQNGLCTRTLGFYDRLPDARQACLAHAQLNSEAIHKIADEHHLCPFELSRHMARWCELVIGDVNYVYDPMVRLGFLDETPCEYAILIDEVHNLNERARQMYSVQLSTAEIATALRQEKQWSQAQRRQLRIIQQVVRAVPVYPKLLTQIPEGLVASIEKVLLSENDETSAPTQDLFSTDSISRRTLLQNLWRFLGIAMRFSAQHIGWSEKTHSEKGRILKILCLDPREFLKQHHTGSRAVVGFSATLSPIDFYRDACGFTDDTPVFALDPVFPAENQLTLACPYIDTRWGRREQSQHDLLDLIAACFEQQPGKYLVFLPSYQYLHQISAAFTAFHPNIKVIRQQQESNSRDRQRFLQEFFHSTAPLIGFAILGGVFGEGIDFYGDRLHGVIIVGAGMAQPSLENTLIRDYYQQRGENAFQLVYQFPGMTRVRQTAGRVIRSENDRGIVVLVDPRFSKSGYHALLPRHWNIQFCNDLASAIDNVRRFKSAL